MVLNILELDLCDLQGRKESTVSYQPSAVGFIQIMANCG
jgi:hypothetical protein